ncbi:hypothetical protein [Burkholderia cenocepacia]|uniref:hypothetical protein n=1 Tax=Burkholderia cenocepacia TaxID=95486 RepID=UPI0022376FBF|nr:hypothetical protein [Burkholderia cenocepacia]MCW5141057.1 hypothetical protein [Burkholderia cenocepacia]
MPIDASIPLGGTAQQQPINPLQAMSQMIAARGNMLQQGALQAQMGANVAQSEAIRNATDPTSGRTDWARAQSLLAQDPRGAYNAPQFAKSVQEMQHGQVKFDADKFDLAVKQVSSLRQQLGGLMADPRFGKGDMTAAIGDLVLKGIDNGTIPPEMAARELDSIPRDPAQQAQFIRNHWMASLKGEVQLQALKPDVQTIDTGGAINIVPIDPMTGAPKGATSFQKSLTPGEAAQRVQTFQDGQPGTVAMGSLVGGGAGGFGDGSYAGGAGGGGAPGGFLPTGPALGQEAAASTLGTEMGKAVANLSAQAEAAPQRVYMLQELQRTAKDFTPGATADWSLQAKNLASSIAPDVAAKIGIDPAKIASQQEFNKYATQLAIAQAGTLGAGTDSKLATALSGNPNQKMNGLSVDHLTRAMIGMERATQAKNAAWQQAGLGPDKFGQWSAQWNRAVDPRVFVVDQMDRAAAQKMIKSLSPKDRDAFAASYRAAVGAGILPHPEAQ